MMRALVRSGACLAALLALAAAVHAQQQWGSIKGQVVWSPAALPAKNPVAGAPAACLKNGPVVTEEYAVDPKSKGVRWVMVWLVDPVNPKAALPVHPKLAAIKEKDVVVDQPCCQFEPRVLFLREGQNLVAKNSATIAHNVKVDSPDPALCQNPLVQPGAQVVIAGWKALPTPTLLSCSIHPWMKGYVRVFDHPYFAVTDEQGNFEIKDAPAGNWNLVLWQENKGWVVNQAGKNGRLGVPVVIQPDKTTNLGQYKLTPD
jgi:hypothetical protein